MTLQDERRRAQRLLAADDREHWLSVKEYAHSRGLNVQTVYSAIRRGVFPYVVDYPAGGRAVRIDPTRKVTHAA